MESESIRCLDPKYYGINWDEEVRLPKRTLRKPLCKECNKPVSTEFGKPKPYCTEHILLNPYAKKLHDLDQIIDHKLDRKITNSNFEKLKMEGK